MTVVVSSDKWFLHWHFYNMAAACERVGDVKENRKNKKVKLVLNKHLMTK